MATRTTQAQIYDKLIEMSGRIAGMDQKMTDMNDKIDDFATRQVATEVDVRAVQQDIRDIKRDLHSASAATDARIDSLATTLEKVDKDVSKIKQARLIAGIRLSMLMGGATVIGGVLFYVFQYVLKPIGEWWIKKEFGG